MAQDEMNTRNTNSAWIRQQNEYQLLIDASKRMQERYDSQGCILYVISGCDNTLDTCIHDCELCIQKWLYSERQS